MAHLIGRTWNPNGERQDLSDGPSKWDLMMATFGSNEQVPNIQFRVAKSSITLPIRLQRIGREDGSGDRFLFSGVLQDATNRTVEGYFDTKGRTGWIAVAPLGADRSFFRDAKGGK